MKTLFIYTDGGARGNPGPAGIGVVIKSETGQVLKKISRRIGETTNNTAEYMAVVETLSYLKEAKHDVLVKDIGRFQFHLDSSIVVNQLNGLYKVKEAHLREFLVKVRILEQELGGIITYRQIPRLQNSEADALVNQALDSKF